MITVATNGIRAAVAGVALGSALAAQAAATAARLRLCEDLRTEAARELDDKRIPGIWIGALDVDPATGDEWSWSAALGRCRDDRPCVAVDDVHRVASVGKVVTAMLALRLAEQGLVDLDAPVQRHLPEFRPRDPRSGEITALQLLQHRSGLPRHGPVGHFGDDAAPGLAATVAGLDDVELLFAPGSGVSYSNAGYAVLGRLLERAADQPFAALAEERLLRPLRMTSTSFAATPALLARSSLGRMWTLDGRAIPTPTFEYGCQPALNLRSTVGDLLALARSLLPSAPRRVLAADGQASMWQRRGDGDVGLGCFVAEFDGALRVEHAGTAPGTSTQFAVLPDEGIAVSVVVTLDFANAVASALADRALRGMRALRAGASLPPPSWPQPLGRERARAVAGRYRCGDEWFDLRECAGELVFDPCIGIATVQRDDGRQWIADDPCAMGGRAIQPRGAARMSDGFAEFEREPDSAPPPPPPQQLVPLLGEYGPDPRVVIVYEDGGRLGVLLDWHVRELPVRLSADVYECPAGAYGAARLEFVRRDGAVVALRFDHELLPRRPDPAPGGFRIVPTAPIPELRERARGAVPPPSPAGLRAADLVPLMPLSSTLRFDIRYATADNFLGTPVYEVAAPSLQRPAAQALLAAHAELAQQGYGLLVFDAYRPWSVTKVFWDATPPPLRHFVADPARGSRHNRGCAVDVTLFDLATGAAVDMPSDFDEFTARAHPDWPGGTARQRFHRDLLRRVMERHGFDVYEHEWWHFDHRDWQQYPVLDLPLR